MEFIEHFHCPFVKKNGTTYATDGFEAVAPITAKVDDNWGVKDQFDASFRKPYPCDRDATFARNGEEPT